MSKIDNVKSSEEFWEASIEELKKGYIQNGDAIKCLVCGETFIIGRIYQINSEFYDARKTAEIHVEEKHNSMLGYLLNMNSTFIGVSDVQKELIKLIAQGLSDKEIAEVLDIAQSTVRNHRYKLREKEKQAKLYLAMMELLSQNTNKKINKLDKEIIYDAHKTATTIDDRYNTTDKEIESTIKAYMDTNGALKTYPSKEKKKIIVLREIMKNFSKGRSYSEKELNRILQRVYEDYVTIRRALIEYGFLDRSNDCSSYWVKE